MKRSTSTEKLPSIDPEEDVVQPVKSIFPQHCQYHATKTNYKVKIQIKSKSIQQIQKKKKKQGWVTKKKP